ncbi:MAG TPA: alkaline phosphatase D family protein [Nocardioidaceae bacterium]|nr:alkaline phosphatase D family protein [Nocardioidaceae bacterium]
MNRRTFIVLGGSTAAAAATTLSQPAWATVAPTVAQARLLADPFTLGVASGDPRPDSVVLWTRLAPSPIDGGGMPDRRYSVAWQVATDERFSQVVQSGKTSAVPDLGHSVHAEVPGLRPDRPYYYRFKIDDYISPVGRTRTAPSPGAKVSGLRWAFASCQNYQDGFYTAYEHLAVEDLAFVAFLGDYIYESVPNPNAVRTHEGTDEPYSLVDYRNRHARYRTDTGLQAAHAAHPWIVTFDDHEIDNNWADDVPQDPDQQTPEAFRARRIAAFQAYYEHMPLRRSSIPSGPDMQVYRRLDFGDLVRLSVLDTRQYRSDQVLTEQEAWDPSRSMTGADQEDWLVDGLRRSHARWNVLANQVMLAQNDRTAGPGRVFDFDNWDGYRTQRQRLLTDLADVRNPLIMTGDRHATWACDLKPDFDDEASPVVGAEITGSSITSGGNPNVEAFHQTYDPIMAESPHWKFIDNQRGYVVLDADRSRIELSLRVVDTVIEPSSPVKTYARLVVEDGVPGISVADVAARPAAKVYDADRRFIPGPHGPLLLDRGQPYRG